MFSPPFGFATIREFGHSDRQQIISETFTTIVTNVPWRTRLSDVNGFPNYSSSSLPFSNCSLEQSGDSSLSFRVLHSNEHDLGLRDKLFNPFSRCMARHSSDVYPDTTNGMLASFLQTDTMLLFSEQ
jgi:hypothetical protein